MVFRYASLIIIAASLITSAVADDRSDKPRQVAPSRLKGVRCIVEPSREVSSHFKGVYKQAWLFFSSDQALQAFQATPEKFEAFANHQLVRTGQYVQHACPLSGETPDEDFATIRVGGVTLQVLCPDCAKEIASETLAEQIEMLFDAEGFKLGKFAPKRKPPLSNPSDGTAVRR
ncbi:MAG: hypothetical protein AAGJ83_01575 [Planctomycetota bacterium]